MKKWKIKRINRIRLRRKRKISRGQHVSWTSIKTNKSKSNWSNVYRYKPNISKSVYKNSFFRNVRIRSGNMTRSNFNNSCFIDVDFIFVNLSNSKFYDAKFVNCMFFGCNFNQTSFKNASFQHTVFISCNFKNIKDFRLGQNSRVVKKMSIDQISHSLEQAVLAMKNNKTLEQYHILTSVSNGVNKWLLAILLEKYTEDDLTKFFNKIERTNKVRFYSFSQYKKSLDKFYKR